MILPHMLVCLFAWNFRCFWVKSAWRILRKVTSWWHLWFWRPDTEWIRFMMGTVSFWNNWQGNTCYKRLLVIRLFHQLSQFVEYFLSLPYRCPVFPSSDMAYTVAISLQVGSHIGFLNNEIILESRRSREVSLAPVWQLGWLSIANPISGLRFTTI